MNPAYAEQASLRSLLGVASKSRWPRYPLRVGRRVRVDGREGRVTRRFPLDGSYTYRVEVEGSALLVPAERVEAL